MLHHTISFKNALRGIMTATTTQLNLKTHLVIATAVCVLGVWLEVSLVEGLILLTAISMVFVAEMVNTAIEFLGNAVTLEPNEDIGRAKDISAGAVLIAALFSALLGMLIFIPRLLAP